MRMQARPFTITFMTIIRIVLDELAKNIAQFTNHKKSFDNFDTISNVCFFTNFKCRRHDLPLTLK